MAPDIDRIVVVGAGDCGTRAALGLRRLGFGGSITLVGDETEVPYERPPLSKNVVVDEHAGLRPIATPAQLEEQKIDWVAGVAAVRIDPDARSLILADDRALSYDRLLLATGSRARRPSVPGTGTIHTIRSAADVAAVRPQLSPGARLLVIGGGFIGLEIAAAAIARGCAVTVVEFAHQLMSRVVPNPVAAIVRERHRQAGVDLRLGLGVERVDGDDAVQLTRFDDGTTAEADVVVAGIGAIPNTELAATAGLSIANGIAVDAQLRTDDPAIYAAGDCCSVPHSLYGNARIRLEAWNNAVAQADLAAANMLGGTTAYDVVPTFWSDQYELVMQVVGLHAAATAEVVRRRADGHEIRFGLDATGRVVSASGVAPGTTLARDLRLAERMIAARLTPAPADLSGLDLRPLLA